MKCEKCGKEKRKENCDHRHIVEIETEHGNRFLCEDCGMISKNRCEVYSRVCGYLRPTSGWNKGKQSEFELRKTFGGAK